MNCLTLLLMSGPVEWHAFDKMAIAISFYFPDYGDYLNDDYYYL